jgi:hypothetical protein
MTKTDLSPFSTLSLAHLQNGLDGIAALGIGDGLIDLVETTALHQAVEEKALPDNAREASG